MDTHVRVSRKCDGDGNDPFIPAMKSMLKNSTITTKANTYILVSLLMVWPSVILKFFLLSYLKNEMLCNWSSPDLFFVCCCTTQNVRAKSNTKNSVAFVKVN